MALTIDSTPPPSSKDPTTVAILRDGSRAVVLLCDGGGSWGAGIEAAAWSVQYLERRWSGACVPAPAVLLADVASLHSVIPKEFLESDFGCRFSLVLLDCSDSAVRYFVSGLFSVVLFDGRDLHTLFHPPTLEAALIKQGSMSEAEASHFCHVGVGPWVTEEALDSKMSEEVMVAPGSYLLILHVAMAEKLDTVILQAVIAASKRAEALQASLGCDIPVVIVAG